MCYIHINTVVYSLTFIKLYLICYEYYVLPCRQGYMYVELSFARWFYCHVSVGYLRSTGTCSCGCSFFFSFFFSSLSYRIIIHN